MGLIQCNLPQKPQHQNIHKQTQRGRVMLFSVEMFTRPINSSSLLTEIFLRNGPNNIVMLSLESLEPFLPSDIETSLRSCDQKFRTG